MRHARLVIFGFALATASTLIACGGGGGGSSTAPAVTSPGNPAGPGNPTNAPTSPISPTPVPSSVSTSPSPGASPVQTVGPSSATISVGYGQTNGSSSPLLISTAPNSRGYQGGGNYMPGQTGATATGGGQGPVNGGAVDGITCKPSMAELYHVHAFLGVFYKGQEVVVPAGIGMVNPGPPNQSVYDDQPVQPGDPNYNNAVPNQTWSADCYYDLHIHDNSGMVHIETANNGNCGAYTSTPYPTPDNQQTECSYPSPYTLQTLLDIWGISLSDNNFGPLQGAVQIYTTPPGYDSYNANGCGTSGTQLIVPCYTKSSLYQYNSGHATDIAKSITLQSHTTIWIVVGTPLPSGLPSVNWEEGDP